MTAPSVFHQELAKRGIKWQKATGCPRTAPKQRVIEIAKTKRAPSEERKMQTRLRYLKWRKMYEDERMSVTDIAAMEGVQAYSVSRGLKKLSVPMRPKGHGEIVAKLKREVNALRGRVAHYRNRLKQYEQEAA